jgi:hypothetical protein
MRGKMPIVRDEDAHVVAGEYGIDLADLYDALSYYYEHREALADRGRTALETRRSGERRTQALLEAVENDGSAETAD